MSNLDFDRCGQQAGPLTCDLPMGHDGPHGMEVPMPPDIGAILAQQLDRIDEKERRLDEGLVAVRRALFSALVAIAGTVVGWVILVSVVILR